MEKERERERDKDRDREWRGIGKRERLKGGKGVNGE